MKELICIQTHSEGLVLAGMVYTCFGERKNACKCKKTVVDVGIRGYAQGSACMHCGVIHNNDGVSWINKALFAEIATIEETVKAEKETVTI